MNVVVLNLTRFGDLIQTQPVLAALSARGDRVTLVCLDNFAAAASLLDGVDQVVAFPGARLLARIEKDWRLAVGELERVRREAAMEAAVDLVVNLTPSLPARLLARVFGPLQGEGAPPGAGIVGFGVDEFGYNADTSPWAAFLQVGSSNRGASPFNLVDLFCRAALLGDGPYPFRLRGPSPEMVGKMGARIRSALPEPARGAPLLGIQLGASEERRRWPVERFAETARLFWEQTGRAAVLFGSASEASLAEQFAGCANSPFASLVGTTGLDELAGALLGVDLLVTNDTGTMHLAAGLGVPLAAIFLATAQPFDTGPYAPGALSLEPDMDCHPCAFGSECSNHEACRQSIPAQTVFSQARAIVDGIDTDATEGTRVWRSRLGEDGLMDLESLSGHGATDRASWIWLQRHHYRRFLDGQDPAPDTDLPRPAPEFCARVRATLGEAGELLFLLERQLELARAGSPGAMQQKFLSNCQRFQDILTSEPALDVLGALWFFQSQSEAGDLDRLRLLLTRYRALILALSRDLE